MIVAIKFCPEDSFSLGNCSNEVSFDEIFKYLTVEGELTPFKASQ